MIRRALLVVSLLILAGCASPDAFEARLPQPQAETAVRVPAPTSVTIPAIGAHSSLIPLGLTPEGALEVPPVDQPMQAGWYAGLDSAIDGDEIRPGENGPAVILGHVDGVINGQKGQSGVFHDLGKLRPGDDVLVDRADGQRLRFVVQRVESHDKDTFPTREVYGDTDGPELRLITCGGDFDRAAGHYVENTIVWAVIA